MDAQKGGLVEAWRPRRASSNRPEAGLGLCKREDWALAKGTVGLGEQWRRIGSL